MNVNPGIPTVEDAWGQQESFGCSGTNYSAVIERLSCSVSVNVSISSTEGNLIPFLSLIRHNPVYT